MAQGRQDTLLSLIAGQICPTVKSAAERTDQSGRKYNLLQAIRTPSYIAKPPKPPKTVVPDVQYGMPKSVTPGSDSTKPTASSGSEAPNPVKVAQQSREWDAAMASLRTGRRQPQQQRPQPRGIQGPIYPTSPKQLPRTGDSYYDNLQSTKDRLEREAIQQREQAVFRKSDIQQEMTPEQLQEKMKGFKTWGESAPDWLKHVISATHKAISSPQTTSVGGPSMLMNHTLQQKAQGNPGFTTPMSDDEAAEAANDTLNNWQQTWERAKQYGGNALRSMVTLPSYLSNSYSAKKFRQGVANANANASALADARIDAITKKYQTGLQDDPALAAINNAVAGGTGAVLGELAAGGAVGKTLGVGAKAIRGVTGTAGRVAGNMVTGALRPVMQKARYVQSGFGNTAKNLAAAEGRATPTIATRNAYAKALTRGPYDDRLVWASRAGKTVGPGRMGSFEERLGNAVQHGFQAAGDVAATPLQLGSDALLHPFQTANAGYARIAPGFRVLRHPVQYAQRAGRAIATHPIQAPVKAVWNGAQRTVFNPTVYGYTQMPGFYGDLYRGDYGSAAGRAGGVGSFGFLMKAPGAAQIPMAVHDFRSFRGE